MLNRKQEFYEMFLFGFVLFGAIIASVNEFYNELSSILDMIEYFKLDEKIGL